MAIGIEELQAVERVMKSGKLSEYVGNWSEYFFGGTEIRSLEKEWTEYFRTNHSIACNSATSGLWLACAAIDLKQGDEVIVTPYSMTCSASMPLHFGATPVFADIEEDYYCLDPKSVESKITSKTRAIIVVDLFGQPYDAAGINYLANKYSDKFGHKIYVIEDASQAPGAKYQGLYSGTLGDIGVYSFNFHKHIQCGEGGMVVTSNAELASKIRLLMNHAEAVNNGMIEPLYPKLVGMNFRLTEIQAAIMREQLKKLDSILKVYREDSKCFTVKVRPNCEHSYYRYAFSSSEFKRLKIYEPYNIKKHYITPLYKMPLFKELGYAQDLCPVCEKIERNIVLAWRKEVI